MIDTEQPKDSARQAQHNKDIYELRLYVVGNNKKCQLTFANLKEICYKYPADKCHIEVIDPQRAQVLPEMDQIVAIPPL
jgi:GAF domain-containing protein